MIKKFVLIVVLLLVATNLWAVISDVSNTKHNLGSTAVGAATGNASQNEDGVCIYCHTPHGGSMDAPLWNRGLTSNGSGFTHYTSATLNSDYWTLTQNISTRAVKTQSLLCLSCHDGTVAMGIILNNSNETGAAPDNGKMSGSEFFFGLGSAQIGYVEDPMDNPGKNLSDDHPISFSYNGAQGANSSKLILADNGANDPRKKGIRFFGTELEQNVECSSCHDPHVDGNANPELAPFLVMSNNGSALCLACHIK